MNFRALTGGELIAYVEAACADALALELAARLRDALDSNEELEFALEDMREGFAAVRQQAIADAKEAHHTETND